MLICDSCKLAEYAITYIYARDRFGWTPQLYSNFKAVWLIILTAGMLFGMPVFRGLKLSDPIIVSLGCISQGIYQVYSTVFVCTPIVLKATNPNPTC